MYRSLTRWGRVGTVCHSGMAPGPANTHLSVENLLSVSGQQRSTAYFLRKSRIWGISDHGVGYLANGMDRVLKTRPPADEDPVAPLQQVGRALTLDVRIPGARRTPFNVNLTHLRAPSG